MKGGKYLFRANWWYVMQRMSAPKIIQRRSFAQGSENPTKHATPHKHIHSMQPRGSNVEMHHASVLDAVTLLIPMPFDRLMA